MIKKLPFFLTAAVIPLPFLSISFQKNNDYFEINELVNPVTKSESASFTAIIRNFEVDRNANSVYFEWIKDKNYNKNKEVRKLESYWFDKQIANKIYLPGSKPEISQEKYALEYCPNLENCRNWQFYRDEKKFRNWKQETIFNLYGEYDKSIFNRISLIVAGIRKSTNIKYEFDISESLNKDIKEKFSRLEKNFGANNFRISNIVYRIGFEIMENEIKDFTINFKFNYQYQKPVLKLNTELKEYLGGLRKKFDNEVLNNNKIILPVSTNDENGNGIRNFSLNPKSEILGEIQKKTEEYSKLLFKDQKKYNSSLKFNIKSDTKIEFLLHFQHPDDKNYYDFKLKDNVNINFLTNIVENQDKFWERLTIIPGKIYEQKDYTPKIDKPIEILKAKNKERKQNFDYIYGGKWEYHDKIKLNFFADEKENEILYVNDKPIDVLDRNFNYELEDLRLDQKDKKNAINKYKVEIKKFEKSDKTQDNSKIIAVYEIEFVIKAANSIMDIKWFAWDPQNNKEQQKLIEPYLKDASGNLVYDQLGLKIKNPKFDPLIDKETGTKKEILWVSTGNNFDSLPENSNFAQLPSEISRLKSGFNADFGFIAEGSVSGKGANITLNSAVENEKISSYRYKINPNNHEKFELLSKKDHKSEKFDITNSTNKYFSNSGIWLFSSNFEKGTSSYKIVAIGENSNSQLFSQIFPNKAIIPFWESKVGQILSQTLMLQKMSWDDIKKLSYEKILLYWRNFIENLVKKQTIKKINAKLDSSNLIKNRIISAIKKKKIIGNSQNSKFKLGKNNTILEINPEMQADLLKIMIGDIDEIAGNELKIENIIENQDGTFNFKINIINKNEKKNGLLGKNDGKFTFKNINISETDQYENKTKIDFKLDKINLLSGEKNTNNYAEIINYFYSQENGDKVDIVLEEEDNKIFANFKVKDEFKNNFFLQKPFILLRKLPETSEIIEEWQNIFEKLDISRINLAGVSNPEKAKKFILDEIEKSWTKEKYKFNADFIIINFDEIVEKVVKNIEESEQIPHKVWDLELKIKPDSNKKFYGGKTIKLVNIVGSLTNPKIHNLGQIRATQFSFSVAKNSQNLENALRDHVYNLLLPEEIDAKKYLYIQNLAQIANNFRANPNLDKATLILEPGTSQIGGKKELAVFNSDFSPNLNASNLAKGDQTKNIFQKKTTWYWIIPLLIFMILGFGFLGFWVYNKFIAKFKH